MRKLPGLLAGLLVVAGAASAWNASRDAAPIPWPPPQPPLTEAEFAQPIADGLLDADVLELLPLFNGIRGPQRDLALASARLFALETFEGNGRTCATCHSVMNGTFTPEEARERHARNPDGPLFRAIDSDAGDGKSYERLLRDGTVTVTIPLPPGVKLADDPDATSVTLLRGTPTFMNVAALDPILMHDARAPNLQEQALDALRVHSQIGREPMAYELDAIAEVQKGGFTSPEIQAYAMGGPEPGLPEGNTDAEKRGRAFFVSQRVDTATGHGICAACHSGPLLDTTNEHLAEFFPQIVPLPGTDLKFGAEQGFRVFTNLSAEINRSKRPVRKWLLQDGSGAWVPVESPDVGFALAPTVVGVPERYREHLSPALRANIFKISSLRGIARTPPYFHDNSAGTLEDAVKHYDEFLRGGFGFVEPQARIGLDERDIADIAAYLRLL